MLLYSEKIILFIQTIRKEIKTILTQEMNLKVQGDRFSDFTRQFSYPLSIVVYNDRNKLGYFDPNFYELGFHERLMYVDSRQLKQIIRHELAHYMTFILHGPSLQPHGEEFKEFCKSMNWGKEVSEATCELHELNKDDEVNQSDLFRKIQKLMALSSSSNPHEAEAAMLKSQELLVKHQLEGKYFFEEEGEKVVLQRIFLQKQRTAKMVAIAKILETFFVSTVFRSSNQGSCLEILGSFLHVQIAEYVANTLDSQFDFLWEKIKKEHHLKGITAKNSFFLGIAKGYAQKVNALKRSYSEETSQALMVVEKQLQRAKELAYKKLSYARSKTSYCQESSILGELTGKQLSIHPGLSKQKDPNGGFLSYQS
jgi:predicted SprT family Zn-dependent metalloprotease